MPSFDKQLAALADAGLQRERRVVTGAQGAYLTVDGRRYLSFCSNDYLGLANHPALAEAVRSGLQQYGVGASASHLISGHTDAHQRLEAALADFVGLPRALYFSSGYLANIGVIPALIGRDGAVFSDQLNHACIIDGVRLSRAQPHIYPHADMAALANMLAQSRSPRKLVVSDAVFSMDGDIAPIAQLIALCERYDAWLLLDDAHGFGVLGEGGRGALAHATATSPNVIYMATLGKAAGVQGAFVAGAPDVIEWLTQRARSYVFSTASPPVLSCALFASLQLIRTESWRRDQLTLLVHRLQKGLAGLPWALKPSSTAIQPLMLGDNGLAMNVMQRLRQRSIWAPAIRPPTVSEGSARLRISLSAAHNTDHVDELIHALRAIHSEHFRS